MENLSPGWKAGFPFGLIINGLKIVLTKFLVTGAGGFPFPGIVQRVTHRPVPARTAKWIRCRPGGSPVTQAHFKLVCRPASKCNLKIGPAKKH